MKTPSWSGVYAAKTDIGRVRVTNEDQARVLVGDSGEVFLIVCDGMGGQNKGDYASSTAIEMLSEAFQNKKKHGMLLNRIWLSRALREANAAIFEEASQSQVYADMGTTCVCALLSGNKLLVANIGDSRAYAFSKNGLTLLTEDQTYVEYLYRTGRIDKEEAKARKDRHALMNAMGVYPSVAIDFRRYDYHGESLLLCSDGLYNNVPENEIRAILNTDDRPDIKVNSLIGDANSNGGSDNVGIAYWESLPHD